MKKENLKTIIYYAGLYFIAGVLLLSGISKIADPIPLIETLKLVTHINEEMLLITATILPVIEIGLALLIVFKFKPKAVLISTLFLFGAFLIFSIYGTFIGLKNDCGCFGSVLKSEIGWGMVGRNVMFFLLIKIFYNVNKKNLLQG